MLSAHLVGRAGEVRTLNPNLVQVIAVDLLMSCNVEVLAITFSTPKINTISNKLMSLNVKVTCNMQANSDLHHHHWQAYTSWVQKTSQEFRGSQHHSHNSALSNFRRLKRCICFVYYCYLISYSKPCRIASLLWITNSTLASLTLTQEMLICLCNYVSTPPLSSVDIL